MERTFQGLQNRTNRDFFIFFCITVTAFPRYTTVLCLLDYRHSDLFTLVGYSFVREDSNVNQSAKGIKWSAVSLPCFSLLTFGKQGSGPGRGQSPVEWGDFTYVCTYKCLSVHSPLWAIQLGLRPSQPGLKPEAWLSEPQA